MTASSDASRQLARFAIIGLIAWAIATVAIRMAPLAELHVGSIETLLSILAGLAAVVALASLLLRDVAPAQRVSAMSAFVLPGMIGDSLATAFCSAVFPNLPSGSAGVFGGLMLAGYAVMLAVSIGKSADQKLV